MLIIGCGYVGGRLARRLHDDGVPVTGWTRTAQSSAALTAQDIPAVAADLDSPLDWPLDQIPSSLLYLAPPPSEGAEDTRMQHFLKALAQARHRSLGAAPRIVYMSTTGVYGNCDGDWVDESRPAAPAVDRARRRWDAEQQLRAWRERDGGELVILRVAGIYGPGRLPLERLQRALPMVRPEDAPWTNRIHADDLVSVCLAAMARGRDGEVYNVTDGTPGNMAEYFRAVADRAGLPRPPEIPLAEAGERLSAGLLSYLAESRRLDNRKMLRELGVTLAYPSLAGGLDACFDEAG